ncbi:MAG: hypothetical protein JWO36_2134 [Myxococcales bacterium]|nr:hypothetical protein [Myxococcales bacterium]
MIVDPRDAGLESRVVASDDLEDRIQSHVDGPEAVIHVIAEPSEFFTEPSDFFTEPSDFSTKPPDFSTKRAHLFADFLEHSDRQVSHVRHGEYIGRGCPGLPDLVTDRNQTWCYLLVA